MRILYVAPYIPSRIRVRPYNFIKHLSQRGHSVYFFGLDDFLTPPGAAEELSGFCDEVRFFRLPRWRSYLNTVLGLFQNTSLQTAYARSSPLKKTVFDVSAQNKFDIIHIEHIRAGYCLPQDRKIPALFDSVDCITVLYRQFAREKASLFGRFLSAVESKKTERYEAHLLSLFEGVIVTSDIDRGRLMEIAAEQKRTIPQIKTITLGVDGSYFQPDNSQVEPASIVFSGKMGYAANALAARHFAEEIFPLIKTRVPQARFTIVGANPPKDVRKLGQKEGIEVTGWVDDIRPFLQKTQVVVCPLGISVGMQFKLLEALAMAKPVVVYSRAARSLKSPAEPVFLEASTPQQFAENVCRLFEEEPLRRALQDRARAYVEKFYDWEEKAKELERYYRELIDEYSPKQI